MSTPESITATTIEFELPSSVSHASTASMSASGVPCSAGGMYTWPVLFNGHCLKNSGSGGTCMKRPMGIFSTHSTDGSS